jgi:hypothetical protein
MSERLGWVYHSGELTTRGCTTVLRSADGVLGRVTRSRGRQKGHRYFVWALPDSAPEYRTVEEAQQAAAAEETR